MTPAVLLRSQAQQRVTLQLLRKRRGLRRRFYRAEDGLLEGWNPAERSERSKPDARHHDAWLITRANSGS